MRYFFDTEFWERGPDSPIQLISIGIAAEDGRTYYAESNDVDRNKLSAWLRENVLPHLQGDGIAPRRIADQVIGFVAGDEDPQFWADYAAYDWVVFCQLFGAMANLPKGWPMFCRDFRQLLEMTGQDEPPRMLGDTDEHHALADAQRLKRAFEALAPKAPLQIPGLPQFSKTKSPASR